MTGLIAFQLSARNIGRRRLALGLGSVVGSGFQLCLSGLYSALGGSHTGPRLHIVQLNQ